MSMYVFRYITDAYILTSYPKDKMIPKYKHSFFRVGGIEAGVISPFFLYFYSLILLLFTHSTVCSLAFTMLTCVYNPRTKLTW